MPAATEHTHHDIFVFVARVNLFDVIYCLLGKGSLTQQTKGRKNNGAERKYARTQAWLRQGICLLREGV